MNTYNGSLTNEEIEKQDEQPSKKLTLLLSSDTKSGVHINKVRSEDDKCSLNIFHLFDFRRSNFLSFSKYLTRLTAYEKPVRIMLMPIIDETIKMIQKRS